MNVGPAPAPAPASHPARAAPQEYERARQHLIKYERLLLKEFGFVTMVEHPHKFVFNLIEMVAKRGSEQILPGHPCHPLLQEAWNLLNDRCAPPLAAAPQAPGCGGRGRR